MNFQNLSGMELVARGDMLADKLTGETFELEALDDTTLAQLLHDLHTHQADLADAKRLLQNETLQRLDRRAVGRDRFGPYTVISSGASLSEQFDELALRESLLKLVDEGVLEASAVDRAVEPVVTYKLKRAGVTALRKHSERVRSLVDSHAHTVEQRRYVRVEKA